MSTQLTLYSREGCHLCDDMLGVLAAFRGPMNFDVSIIDIDRDSALVEKYNALVPVLMLDGEEVCHHFFDKQALEEALARTAG
jgi:glutaredoxin